MCVYKRTRQLVLLDLILVVKSSFFVYILYLEHKIVVRGHFILRQESLY